MEYEPIVSLPKLSELPKIAQLYIDELKDRSRYDKEGEAIEWIFKKFPENININEVIIKVLALDSSYSTNLRGLNLVLNMAYEIVNTSYFDERIKKRDLSLVDDLSNLVKTSEDIGDNEKKSKPFSFASKYCCLQNIALMNKCNKKMKQYAIYDSYVAKVLTWYQENENFLGNNGRNKIKDTWLKTSYKAPKGDKYKVDALKSSYEKLFYPVILCFQHYNKLCRFSLRDLDHFLWRMGQEFFLDYKIVKYNDDYVIRVEGTGKPKIKIYKSCPITDLDKVSSTLKYKKRKYERRKNEKDYDFALRMLKDSYVCVIRKEGIVGDYYIDISNNSSVKLFHIIYDSESKQNGNIKDILHDFGKNVVDDIKENEITLKNVCNEIIAQQSNKKDAKVDKESPQNEEIKTKPLNNDKNVEKHEQNIPPKIRTSIKIGDYTIEIAETNAVSIKGGKESKPVKTILKDISKLLEGFKWEEKWNTRDAGRHIVKYAKEHPKRIKTKIE